MKDVEHDWNILKSCRCKMMFLPGGNETRVSSFLLGGGDGVGCWRSSSHAYNLHAILSRSSFALANYPHATLTNYSLSLANYLHATLSRSSLSLARYLQLWVCSWSVVPIIVLNHVEIYGQVFLTRPWPWWPWPEDHGKIREDDCWPWPFTDCIQWW